MPLYKQCMAWRVGSGKRLILRANNAVSCVVCCSGLVKLLIFSSVCMPGISQTCSSCW